MKAWHFLNKNRKLGNGDGRLVRKGSIFTVDPPIELCRSGLHASIRLIDALQYAPGPIICRVEMRGDIIHGSDKLVATERKCLWWINAERMLHEFACWCAKGALEKARVTDRRCWIAIETKLAWLKGKATNQELDAAWSAAQSAAQSAAESAAWSAAQSAAWSAAQSAAESAARSAAWSAARSAAESAAWSAQNIELITRVEEANV